jgi:hypothetical protein
MNLTKPQDSKISIDDSKNFVTVQDVPADTPDQYAYQIDGPDDYLIVVEQGTPVAPEFRDSTGTKLDGSDRVTIQKCDKQGNPIGSGIVFTELLNRFDYAKMRTDDDYFRYTNRHLMIDEREIVKVFVDIPASENGFDAVESQLTIGDETSDFGKAVEIIHKDNLTDAERRAVGLASQTGGNGGN